MDTLLVALHGILTNQTDPSWPDKLDAWMSRRDPAVKVLKKEYAAGPFPRWNCWIKDPRLARSLANELELFLECSDGSRRRKEAEAGLTGDAPPYVGGYAPQRLVPRSHALTLPRSADAPAIWFVAHSNGAVIALLTARRLVARGFRLGGLILTGAACEAELERNGVMEWWNNGVLGAAIAYCSADDRVLDGAPSTWPEGRSPTRPAPVAPGHPGSETGALRPSILRTLKEWFWGKLMWPYGCLGRTGWMLHGQPFPGAPAGSPTRGFRNRASQLAGGDAGAPRDIFTRWFPGGHTTYFKPENLERTFEQIYQDLSSNPMPPRPTL